MLFIFSILNIPLVPIVVAPPLGGSSSSGFITSTGSEIQIVEASINMSITSEPIGTAYHFHAIHLQGQFNVTNPLSVNESILLLYRPCWETSFAYYNSSSFETSIEGPPLAFSSQTLFNITHPRQLPEVFHDRYPEWVYLQNQTYYTSIPFTMLNLTLGPYQSIILHFSDLINVTSISVHYSEVGFGLGAVQIESDSTQIRMRITVIEGTQFIDVNPYPHDHLIDSQEEIDYFYIWNAYPPFSSRLFNFPISYPIGAGFSVQMEVTEYNFPFTETTSTTISTTSTTTTSSSSHNILTDFLVVSAVWSLFILVIAIFWKKGANQ